MRRATAGSARQQRVVVGEGIVGDGVFQQQLLNVNVVGDEATNIVSFEVILTCSPVCLPSPTCFTYLFGYIVSVFASTMAAVQDSQRDGALHSAAATAPRAR